MLAVQVSQQAREEYKAKALRHRRHVQRNEVPLGTPGAMEDSTSNAVVLVWQAGAQRRARGQAMERRRVWLQKDPCLCLLPRSVRHSRSIARPSSHVHCRGSRFACCCRYGRGYMTLSWA